MYELIITEKPSAALKIAYALADTKPSKKAENGVPYYELKHKHKNIVVSCAVGHLYTVTQKEDKKGWTYPIFELKWELSSKVSKGSAFTSKYASVIRKLAKNARKFTVATDYDIEGEVIGLNVIKYLCKQKDAGRMKFSTLTKPDLVESYDSKQDHLDWGQAHAGETRHKLDWLYGINVSRALSLAIRKNHLFKTLSSGRVQGPALKIIVEKEKEIQAFEPKKFWQIQLKGKIGKHNIEAWHEKDKFWDEEECRQALRKVKGHDGVVVDVNKSQKQQLPPYPFDLTTLQTESYRVFGISPKQTLSIAQNLYINSLISYPRTSSQKLSPKIGYKRILDMLAKQYPKHAEKVLSGRLVPMQGKKDDPAHPAIYPTGEFKPLEGREKKLYDLICKRFFACFGTTAVRESNHVKIDVNSENFIAKGVHTLVKGWHELYEPYVKQEENKLPAIDKGEQVKENKFTKFNKETQPPKRYTPASIIKELEKRNLGTKATRAQIIEALYDREYVTGPKAIEATQLGMHAIRILGKYSPEIIDEELTKHFEEEMELLRQNKVTPTKVLDEAKGNLGKLLDNFKEKEDKIGKELAEALKETHDAQSLIGECPVCAKEGRKGELVIKRGKFGRFIACKNYPECTATFKVPQTGILKGTGKKCETCGLPMISIQSKGSRPRIVCMNIDCKSKTAKMDPEEKKEEKEIKKHIVEKECPKCGEPLVLRKSVYGEFLGCSAFPKCKHTEKISDGPLKEDFSK